MRRIYFNIKPSLVIQLEKLINDLIKTEIKKFNKTNAVKIKVQDNEILITAEETINKIGEIYNDVGLYILSKLDINGRGLNKGEETLIKSLTSTTLNYVAKLVAGFRGDYLRTISNAVVTGENMKETSKKLQELGIKSKNHAELIAITETARVNSEFSRYKCNELNINKGGWSSAKDKRARKCHLARDGVIYDLKKGCYSRCDGKYLQVGSEPRCRCAMFITI